MSNSFATPWTVAHQAPLSMGFLRQEYWSGLPFPSPGDLPDPGIRPMSSALQADSSLSEPPEKPAVGKAKRGAGCTCFPNQRETFLALKFNNFSALLTADPGKSCFILSPPPILISSIPGLGRSPWEGKGYPLQYSGLENSMDCIVHGIRKESNTAEWYSLQPKDSNQPLLSFILIYFFG